MGFFKPLNHQEGKFDFNLLFLAVYFAYLGVLGTDPLCDNNAAGTSRFLAR
jgi:hypothetical protein